MSDFDDELRAALSREAPPADFAERVIARLPRDRVASAANARPHEAPQQAQVRPGISSLLARAAGAALYYLKPSQRAWGVSSLAGAPKVGPDRIERGARLKEGDWLETDNSSRAKIEVGRIGYVEVEPGSCVRLVAARLRDHRLALLRGCLRATIWAPPRLFFVETPSATAVDLGCAYVLRVTDAGSSFLHVTSGWVALALAGRDSIVPAGALCETRAGLGPGTPYFEDAPAELRRALATFDFESDSAKERADALSIILALSRERDALTLWHLLSRVEKEGRARTYQRLCEFVSPPAGVTREGVLRLDRTMLDRWREKLELDWFADDPAWRKAWRRAWRRQ